MAQLAHEKMKTTYDGEIEPEMGINLQEHLTKHDVASKVVNLLQEESITVGDLLTFTSEDLKDWCNEHSLKTIERRRFMNAVKALPNAEANKQQMKVVKVYLGNEEKEQMKQFDEMKTNINKLIDNIQDIIKKKTCDEENVIKDINTVCDQMQVYVENLRKNLLQQVINVFVFVFVYIFLLIVTFLELCSMAICCHKKLT